MYCKIEDALKIEEQITLWADAPEFVKISAAPASVGMRRAVLHRRRSKKIRQKKLSQK